MTVGARGAITLDGAVKLDVRTSTLDNAGMLTTMGANSPNFSGNVTNTGAIHVNANTDLFQGVASPTATLLNQGSFSVATGVSFVAHGGTTVTNDTGGSITTAGTGQFVSQGTFNQGAGTTTTANNPVVISGGTLAYTGNGASSILIPTAANLSGTSAAGQLLRIRADAGNTNVIAASGFTNGGTITLDGSNGATNGAPHLDMRASTLTNSGTIALATGPNFAAPVIAGNLTNTGTLQVDADLQHAGSTGPTATLDNTGTIAIANGATLSSGGSSCGSNAVAVTNDAGGQIVATGTGTLSPTVYNQGAGITSGPTPVTFICGFLNYTGSGASQVLVTNGVTMSGNTAAGQGLTVTSGTISAGTFTNAGTITLAETTSGGGLSVGAGTLTNTGTISANGTQLTDIDGGHTFVNSGALLVNTNVEIRGMPNNFTCPAVCLNNQGGDVEIAAGKTLDVHNDFLQSAGTTILGGAGATLSTFTKVDLQGGTLSGLGTVQGPLNNGGTVSPGPAGGPGTLTVNGAYSQSSGGTLTTRVSSSASDRLTVNGTASLAGTLSISTTGSPPAVGQTFIALSDTSQIGTFGTIGGSSSYDVVYHPTDVTLVAKNPAGRIRTHCDDRRSLGAQPGRGRRDAHLHRPTLCGAGRHRRERPICDGQRRGGGSHGLRQHERNAQLRPSRDPEDRDRDGAPRGGRTRQNAVREPKQPRGRHAGQGSRYGHDPQRHGCCEQRHAGLGRHVRCGDSRSARGRLHGQPDGQAHPCQPAGHRGHECDAQRRGAGAHGPL